MTPLPILRCFVQNRKMSSFSYMNCLKNHHLHFMTTPLILKKTKFFQPPSLIGLPTIRNTRVVIYFHFGEFLTDLVNNSRFYSVRSRAVVGERWDSNFPAWTNWLIRNRVLTVACLFFISPLMCCHRSSRLSICLNKNCQVSIVANVCYTAILQYIAVCFLDEAMIDQTGHSALATM